MICGDFKITFNQNTLEDKDMTPTFDDLRSKSVDGEQLTVIDRKGDYRLVVVDED